MSADEVAAELQRVQARKAMDAAYEAELVLALAAARPDCDDPPPGHPGARRRGAGSPVPGTSEFLPDELAMVLNCSRPFAASVLSDAYLLIERMRPVWAACGEGRLDWHRARVFADVLGPASDEVIAVVVPAVLPLAAGLSSGKLRNRLIAAAVAADEEFAERRRIEAERRAAVRLHPTGDGLSALTTELPSPVAAAMWSTIDQAAQLAKTGGDDRPIGVLRAEAHAALVLRPWDTSRPPLTGHVTVTAPLSALRPPRRPAPPGAAGGGSGGPRRPGRHRRLRPTVGGTPITAAHLRELLAQLGALGVQAPAGGSLALALTDDDGALLATVTPAELARLAARGCPDHGRDADCACPVLGPPATSRATRTPPRSAASSGSATAPAATPAAANPPDAPTPTTSSPTTAAAAPAAPTSAACAAPPPAQDLRPRLALHAAARRHPRRHHPDRRHPHHPTTRPPRPAGPGSVTRTATATGRRHSTTLLSGRRRRTARPRRWPAGSSGCAARATLGRVTSSDGPTATIRAAAGYLRTWLETQAAHRRVPGVQVAVRSGGELVLSAAVGVADVGHRHAAHDRDTSSTSRRTPRPSPRPPSCSWSRPAGCGSTTRSATYVPELAAAGSPIARVTVRELLGHQSGVTRDGAHADFWQLETPFPDRARAGRRGAARRGRARPQRALQVLQRRLRAGRPAVEAVTGTSFASTSPTPSSSRSASPGPAPTTTPSGRASTPPGTPGCCSASRPGGCSGTRGTGAYAPATGFWSTAEELSAFAEAALVLGDERLLPDDAKRIMQRQESVVTAYGTEIGKYGLGVELTTVGDRQLVGHSGGWPGHITLTLADPATDLVVSVLTNAVDGPAQELAHGLVKLVDAALTPRAEVPAPPADAPPLASFTGRFAGLWGVLDVAELGGRLVLVRPTAARPAARHGGAAGGRRRHAAGRRPARLRRGRRARPARAGRRRAGGVAAAGRGDAPATGGVPPAAGRRVPAGVNRRPRCGGAPGRSLACRPWTAASRRSWTRGRGRHRPRPAPDHRRLGRRRGLLTAAAVAGAELATVPQTAAASSTPRSMSSRLRPMSCGRNEALSGPAPGPST